jgi:uncharacterized protein (DUF302 family)
VALAKPNIFEVKRIDGSDRVAPTPRSTSCRCADSTTSQLWAPRADCRKTGSQERRSKSELFMQSTTYGIKVDVALPWDAAVTRTIDALKMEGFGVLTTIDVQATLRAKLGREFRKYVILGACNPVLADRALHAELEVGLLLPCNVIVYETEPSHAVVAAMAPLAALGIVGDNSALHAVAVEADARLKRALESLVTQASVTNV